MNSEETIPATITTNRGSKLYLFLLVPLCLAVAAIAVAIVRRTDSHLLTLQAERMAVLPVSVVHPSELALPGSITLPATVEAFRETPIFARSSGYIRSWSVDIGSWVRTGQTLAVVDAPDLDEQVHGAEASLAQANARLYLSDTTAGRYRGLQQSQAVTQEEIDQATQGFRAQQASVQAAKADAYRWRQLQSFERVAAPFDGIITHRGIDVGDLIDAGRGAPNTELFRLSQIDTMRVFVNVPEAYATSIDFQGAALVVPFSSTGSGIEGKVVRSSHAIGQESHTMKVEVDIRNGSGAVLPGSYANVTLHLNGATKGLSVPSGAILYQADGPQVATVSNGRIVLKRLRLGNDYGEVVEVLSGLRREDSVVASPPDFVVDGMEVEVAATAQ